MSVVTWTGNAHSVKQISTVTFAGTWAGTDTVTATINGKDLIVTCGTATTTTALAATALKEAWEAATRLDGTGTTDSTSNFGGQEFGEFAEITASVSGSVVTLIGNKAGKPFTLSVADTASGSATGATAQSATGCNHWDNGDNWDGGSVPANNDTVVFRDSNVSCLYGLPNASLEVTLQVWMSFTGEIGLPRINADDPVRPYYEYRQRYVRLDDSGAGTNIAHRFGLGKDGTGPTLINLKHSTLKCSPIVYNTGPPFVSRVGTKALNICCTDNTSTLTIFGGSVDFSSQDGGTSAFVTVIQNGGSTRGVNAMYANAGATVTVSGGDMLIGGTGIIGALQTRSSGRMRVENQTGTVSGVTALIGSIVEWAASGTITAATIFGGTLDLSNCPGCTITTLTLYRGSKFLDPFAAMTVGANAYVYYDPTDGLALGNSETTARLRIV